MHATQLQVHLKRAIVQHNTTTCLLVTGRFIVR
jgi:hypothetical protein